MDRRREPRAGPLLATVKVELEEEDIETECGSVKGIRDEVQVGELVSSTFHPIGVTLEFDKQQ